MLPVTAHSDKSAGAGYQHGQPVEAMKAAVEKLIFDGFTVKTVGIDDQL